MQVWIDFNNDGTFQTSEMVLTSGGVTASSGVGVPYTITLPGSAASGSHRMRTIWNWSGGTPLPCTSYSYDEIRDFKVLVLPAPPPCTGAPNPGIVSPSIAQSCVSFSPSLFGVGETIAATGITYQWQSSTSATGPFTNISGATGQSYIPPTISSVGTTYFRDTVTCTNTSTGASTPARAITYDASPVSHW